MGLIEEVVPERATICIPNYKTLDFTRLCLRSIRKFTHYPYKVVVVDNDSQDESLEYLRSLSWIRLIEQSSAGSELTGSVAEGSALDLGLKECDTEFYVVMHSDTFVQKENWLTDLIEYFGNEENVACVGSDKIELKPKWQVLLKNATDFRTFKRKVLREPDPFGKFRYHSRTICCIYRTAILKQENFSFMPDKEKCLTAGKGLYFGLVDRGYKTVELSPAIMGRYVIHLAHATQAINLDEFSLRKKTIRKCNRIIRRVMSSEMIRGVLADNSLDS